MVLESGYVLVQPLEQAGHRVVGRDRPRAPEVRLALTEDARAATAVEREHLVLRRRPEHRPEVIDVRRELGLDLLAHELGHRLHARRGVARLVVEVRVLERRPAQLLDVLGRQVEAAAHRLAVERPGAGQREHRAELDGLALASAGLLDAEQLGEVGLAATPATAGGRRAAAGRSRLGSTARRRGRAAAARRRCRAAAVVVVTAGRQQRGGTDRPRRPQQHPASGDAAVVDDLRPVLVIHRLEAPCFCGGAACVGVATQLGHRSPDRWPCGPAHCERAGMPPPPRRQTASARRIPLLG